MRWRLRTQVYLPLTLLFWLLGSVGSLAIGVGLRQTPEGLNGVTSSISQGLGSLFANALGVDAYAAQSEAGPSVSTAVAAPPKTSTPPKVTTPPPPHTAAPAAPTKVNQTPNKDKGPGSHGKGHKDKGDNGDKHSGNSDD